MKMETSFSFAKGLTISPLFRSVILDRLADNGRTYQQATTAHLSNYAEDGLRTMLFAYKEIKPDEYEKWNSLFTQAKATIGPEREDLLENVSEMIEKDLILLGAVAIEDKLQKGVSFLLFYQSSTCSIVLPPTRVPNLGQRASYQSYIGKREDEKASVTRRGARRRMETILPDFFQVPECIDKLAQAGLKIWLLTGDKTETAVNIGYACSLLRQDMKQVHLTLSKEAESKNLIKVMREDILGQIERYSHMVIKEDTKDRPFALIVDGKALEIALNNDIKDQLLRLAVRCDSVICCRVSPKQKALITRLVKQHTGKTTLAVGDGANDVGMIQEADIGVGISGMEGMQAVMASDFSMPQFRFLERLLIVHGHWCYKRISKLILYFVYKNVAFGLTLFFYDILTTSSGQVLFDDWYIVIFNVFLTSLPVISLGVLEQDVSYEVCLKFPTLYQQGPKNICFSWKRIIGWILNASLTSLVIFTISISALSPAAFTQGGEVADIGHIGAIIYTCIIWTLNCQIALIINHFTWISHLLIWGSIIFWYIFLFLYGMIPPDYSKTGFHLLTEAMGPAAIFWIVTLLAVVASLLPYFIHIVIQRSFLPMDDHLIQEMEHFRMDIVDGPMWLKEQQKSNEKTKVGFSARVDTKIRQLKEQLNRKKKINV
uniref:Phospholipid-transporting ATPase n=1 Tax=Solanum lycopersicum TaxID=4081 RepID=A0A3Q7FMV5_SOLLC